ncbi:MAG: hypothetical protein ACYDAM_12105 [Leptospirales bacterium]
MIDGTDDVFREYDFHRGLDGKIAVHEPFVTRSLVVARKRDG